MTLLQRAFLAVFAVSLALPVAATGPTLPPDGATACRESPNCAAIGSQEITGTILIKRKLTKPSVTASVSLYQRGTTVELGKDAAEDPLAYERSRVVLYLEGPNLAQLAAARLAPVAMEQLDRRFTPDLVVVPVGSSVSFPNMDPIFHNIFSLSKPKEFDLGSYNKGDSRSVTFTKPGVVYVYCHLHPNMAATIVVTPSRYFVRADPSGQFRIPNVPPGQYTLVAWHKAAGFFRKPVQIEAGYSAVVDFFIPIEDVPQKTAMKADSMAGMGGR
jgi:plastocyanin